MCTPFAAYVSLCVDKVFCMYVPDNWHLFLDENNVPSSPLIVEGANIFITADARTKLFEVGKVAIVKDSSANKVSMYVHTRMYNRGYMSFV